MLEAIVALGPLALALDELLTNSCSVPRNNRGTTVAVDGEEKVEPREEKRNLKSPPIHPCKLKRDKFLC